MMRNSKLPYATAVLVLGISSVALSCCYGIPGILTGSIALFLYGKDRKVYEKNKGNYSNYESLKIGRTLSILGISLSTLFIVYLLVVHYYL